MGNSSGYFSTYFDGDIFTIDPNALSLYYRKSED